MIDFQKVKWVIEEKLNFIHRCPKCKCPFDPKGRGFNINTAECERCERSLVNYIYFRLNVRYFGVKKALTD